jgi:hypothetical protein
MGVLFVVMLKDRSARSWIKTAELEMVANFDATHPAVCATARLLPLIFGVDRNSDDATFQRVHAAIQPVLGEEENFADPPFGLTAPLLDGYIRAKNGGFLDLFFDGPMWRAEVRQHDLGQDYFPTVVFPWADGGSAFSLSIAGDAVAYADWAARGATLLMLHQRVAQ